MQDVSKGEGRTVLFVSHNMASVKQLCKSGVLLENGSVKSIGKINTIVDEYLQDNVAMSLADGVWTMEDAPGCGGIKVLRSAVEFEGTELTADKPFDLVYEFYCEYDNITVGLNPHIYNQQEICIFNIGSGYNTYSKGLHKVVFHVPSGLFCAGSYRVDNLFYSAATAYFNHRQAHSFVVENAGKRDFTNYLGVIYPTMIKAEIIK
jgi:lipopolysaccharide transport system ATP-binding protein